MHKTPKQLIVAEWSPPSNKAQLRNRRMVLASRGRLPNAGGDTKANMITYLQAEFAVVLSKKTLRTEVEAVLCQRLQLGDVLDTQGSHHHHHYLHHYRHQHPPPATTTTITIITINVDIKQDTKTSEVVNLRTQVTKKRSQVWSHHRNEDAYTGLNKAEYVSEASVADVNLNTFMKESVHLTRHPNKVVEVDHVLEIHLAKALLDKVVSDTHDRRVLRNDRKSRAARTEVVSSLRRHMNGVRTNLNNTTRQINNGKYEACKQVRVDINNCILNGSPWSSLNATGTLSDKLKIQNFKGPAVQRIVAQMAISCNNIVRAIGESENGMVNDFSALLAGDFMDKLVL
jgi:hypothetical protein